MHKIWGLIQVGLFAVEEVRHKFDDTGNTGGTADQDDFMNIWLVNLGIVENLLNGVKSTAEEILA